MQSKCWKLSIAVFICSLSTSTVVAQDVPLKSNDDIRGYWTAERLLNAELKEAPDSSLSMNNLLVSDDAYKLFNSSAPISSAGSLPNAELSEANIGQRLFAEGSLENDITADNMPEANDVGTSGAHFSSSRLIPTDARLFYPYATTGKLFFTQPDGNFVCSGSVIGPRLILTAGHCVHNGNGDVGGYYGNFLFVPAYHEGDAPYLAWDWSFVITTSSWFFGNNTVPNAADFAIIVAFDQNVNGGLAKIGDLTGWLGWRTNSLLPNHVKQLGYPGAFDSGQIMHQVDAGHWSSAGEGTVLYGSDMTGGSSGGPFVMNFGSAADGQTGGQDPFSNGVVGVNSYRSGDPNALVIGSSTLNDEFVTMWETACGNASGNC